MFEKATRLKLRFNYKGQASVEDLWELPLKSLDEVYKQLNAELKAKEGESLLDVKSSEDSVLTLKIEIVKHIFKVKMDEKTEKDNAAEKSAQKQKILSIISEKQDETLKNMSIEDLRKLKDTL